MNSVFVGVLRLGYRPIVRWAARQTLEGRFFDPGNPERGRWLRSDVNEFLTETWDQVDQLVVRARLSELPTFGSRHNVFLAAITTAAYEALLGRGVSCSYAASLVGDVGWKIYAWMLRLASAPFRLTSRDPQKRLERTLRALMVFPFSAPGAPAYEVSAWAESGRFFTHWTHCPPQTFVRRLVEEGEDKGELDAFYSSWCLYDWSAAQLIAGRDATGEYERKHTLSRGDAVCDMCWRAYGSKAGQGRQQCHSEPMGGDS